MRREVRAIQVAIACAVVGVGVKLTAGFITGSMSMISSAIDSAGDLFVSIANLFVVRLASREADDDHNYGHAKIEGLGAMFEGGFIFAAGVFVIYEAVHKLFVGEVSHDSTLGILVMLPILAMTIGTVLYLRKVARETGSLVIRSDALHYLTDVYMNVGVIVALALVKITGRPEVDSIISIAIALYMLYSSAHIVAAGFHVVMDRSLDPPVVERLTALLGACTRIQSFHDFKTRSGRPPQVDFHVVVEPAMTVQQMHELFLELQARIRELVDPATRVLIHADPAPSGAPGERDSDLVIG